jgi:nitroreductase
MNEVIKALLERRSIRSFITDKKIAREDLEAIVKTACYAPSAMNRQTWHFTVVQDQQKIKMLAETLRVQLGREKYDFFCPNAIIICSNDRECIFAREDCACAMENIMVAAHSLGIGSVWINQFNGVCDEPAVRKALKEVGVPENNLVWGTAALGYEGDGPRREITKKEDVVDWVL